MKYPTRMVLVSQLFAAMMIWIGVWHPGWEKVAAVQAGESANSQFNELKKYVEDVPEATAYRYGATDSAGHSMDTAKIIADPEGGYLAIYHSFSDSFFEVHLARSSDLMHWQYLQSYGSHTHQPYLAAAPDGGFVLANEADKGGYNWVQVRYYASRAELLANHPLRSFDAPHTLAAPDHSAEGTPNIYSVTLDPDIDHSRIDIGFHYFQNSVVDRQARGTLVNFKTWTTRPQPALDDALLADGVQGNIGDRDQLSFHGRTFLISEGQLAAGDFSTWRVFLRDEDSRSAVQLEVHTHGGSQAFANPNLSILPSPRGGGGLAVVVTYFLPAGKQAPDEAGELIFYHDLPES